MEPWKEGVPIYECPAIDLERTLDSRNALLDKYNNDNEELNRQLVEARKAAAISETRESKWMAMVDVLQRAFDSASDKLIELRKAAGWTLITPEMVFTKHHVLATGLGASHTCVMAYSGGYRNGAAALADDWNYCMKLNPPTLEEKP